jgi:hypothetical protein
MTGKILTSSSQIFNELFDCEWDILSNAEHFIDRFCASMKYSNVKLTKEDKEMAQMLKVAFTRRWNLMGAQDVLEEFEHTTVESKNFQMVSEKTMKKVEGLKQ